MGLLDWLKNNDPEDAVQLEKGEQFWNGHGVRRQAPKGRSNKMKVGKCTDEATPWTKSETDTALGKDELDEALEESGWGR